MSSRTSGGARTAALALALLPTLATAAPGPTTLDFDQFPGVYFGAGTPVVAESRLADQFLDSHGVRFSSTAGYASLIDLGVGHAYSGRVGVGGTTADGRVSYSTDVIVSFFDKATGLAGVTDGVSWITDRAGDYRNVTLTAFDVDGRQIAQQTWRDAGYTVLSLALAGIHSVTFTGSSTAALDNFSFNAITLPAASVPEPGSTGLLAAGLVAMAWGRRRRVSPTPA